MAKKIFLVDQLSETRYWVMAGETDPTTALGQIFCGYPMGHQHEVRFEGHLKSGEKSRLGFVPLMINDPIADSKIVESVYGLARQFSEDYAQNRNCEFVDLSQRAKEGILVAVAK